MKEEDFTWDRSEFPAILHQADNYLHMALAKEKSESRHDSRVADAVEVVTNHMVLMFCFISILLLLLMRLCTCCSIISC